MESFQRKSLTTSRGFTFTYYVSADIGARPTLLLLHGFPDNAHLWDGIASKLTQYRLIIPDLLGYSDTSKPTDPVAFNLAGHAGDLVEILDAERVETVISVGHDWGAMVAQRLYVHHPDRVRGLILLSMGYIPPSPNRPSLEELNKQLEGFFGYPAYAYHEFFVSDEAPILLRENLDRFYQLLNGAPREFMKEKWCQRGQMRKWLLDHDENVELRKYAQDPEFQRTFLERFQRDGFESPLCYYKMMHSDANVPATKDLPKERFIVQVPACQITCTQDPVCRAELSIPAKAGGFLPDWEEHTIDSGHWVPYERPDEAAELIESFLQRRFPA